MVEISNVAGVGNAANANPFNAADSGYREADFMAIMLAEITHQDPMNPSETSELVKGMQQLQELSNAKFEKYRQDLEWAQNVMGRTVTVGQVQMADAEYESHLERGLQPDRGFGTVNGPVTFFRNIGESVWVRIGDYDYPIDKIQTVAPEPLSETYFTGMADHLVGRKVGYMDDASQFQEGTVDEISWDESGNITVYVGNEGIAFERIRNIGNRS